MDNNVTSPEKMIFSPTGSKPDVTLADQKVHAPINIPFVSIIMPIRNEAAYIIGCLTAVFEQDYPTERMEILIADGMSDDNSRAIIHKISKDSNIPVTILDNPGTYGTWGSNW